MEAFSCVEAALCKYDALGILDEYFCEFGCLVVPASVTEFKSYHISCIPQSVNFLHNSKGICNYKHNFLNEWYKPKNSCLVLNYKMG